MSRITRMLRLLLLVALLLGMYRPVAGAPVDQETPEPPAPQGIRFDAPAYAVDGPSAVGVRYFTIPAEAEHDRELTATVWYPAEKPKGATERMIYELQFAPGELPPFSVLGHAQLDAPPDASGAPYPLIVYSHAHWSMGQEVPYFVEHLASRGFVVIAVDHEDNWSTDLGPMAYETLIRRPQEVTRQIDFAEELSAPDGELAGLIATDKVGIGGWSMGGVTSLAAAGARMDLAGLRAWCDANPTLVEENAWACVDMLDHEVEMAEFAGLGAVPTGLWPGAKDDRIAAAVRLSGSLFMFGSEGMASVDVPVMLFHGGGEAAADPGLQVGEPYASVGSPRKAEVVFDHAGHLVFNSSCDDNPDMAAMGFPMFCTDPVWDMDRAHDLINHFVTAFLLAELKGDAEAAAALAPETVSFPGIEYQATGYSAMPAPEAALDDATMAKIETMVEEMMARNKLPGFALGVLKDGELVYAKGFGVTSLDGGEPVTPQTVFQWAEASMAPTAIAVLQLVDQGKLSLDAPVTDYLPYFKMNDERYGDITVGQLLMQTSGIPDSGDWMADWENFMPEYDSGATERWIRSDLAKRGLLFAPGTGFEYSDLGYALLGAVVAAASGQTYEAYMKENLFQPLGMNHSTFLLEEVDRTRLAAPHVVNAAGEVAVSEAIPYHRPFAASNNLFTSIEDMAKLVQATLNGGILDGQRILPEDAVEQMWTAQSPTPYAEYPFGQVYPAKMMLDWGYGWFLGEAGGHLTPNVLGREHGFMAHATLVPDANMAVIAVGNGPLISERYAADVATDVVGGLLQE